MADEFLVKKIQEGPAGWNAWRSAHQGEINLDGAILNRANLQGINLSGASLVRAELKETIMVGANLSHANLSGADFYCSLLLKANLTEANLYAAYLREAHLDDADLAGANLQSAVLVETSIERTRLKNAKVYGISAWDLIGQPKDQSNLIITPDAQATITVDDLQVAQFVYLLLHRENLRNVIDTITSKAVLILGRFTPERKMILDAMADELRKHNLLPIIFDFEKPKNRDFTETIKTLAGISFFIIADITNPKSSPLELQATVPDFQIPLVPIMQQGETPFSMFSDLIGKYDWVMQPISYSSLDTLRRVFKNLIIDPAIHKHQELQIRKAHKIHTLSADEYLAKGH